MRILLLTFVDVSYLIHRFHTQSQQKHTLLLWLSLVHSNLKLEKISCRRYFGCPKFGTGEPHYRVFEWFDALLCEGCCDLIPELTTKKWIVEWWTSEKTQSSSGYSSALLHYVPYSWGLRWPQAYFLANHWMVVVIVFAILDMLVFYCYEFT